MEKLKKLDERLEEAFPELLRECREYYFQKMRGEKDE